MADQYVKLDLWTKHLYTALALALPGLFCGGYIGKELGSDPRSPMLICSAITGIVGLLWLLSATKINRGSNHIVLHRGDRYYDLGAGPVSIGIAKWTNRVLDYDPKMRTVEKQVSLQSREGRFINATMIYSWKPDPDNLAEYFAENQDKRIGAFATILIKGWAKQLSSGQIFSEHPITIVDMLDGVKTGGPFLSNFVPEDGPDMSGHVRDNIHLLQSIIDEVEDESRIDAVRLSLSAAYPDREHRINRLCDQRKAELRRRGLRA